MGTEAGDDMDTTRPVRIAVSAWRPALPVVGLAAVSFVLALVVHHLWFRYGSGDRDEAIYQYQAQLLRDGHLSVPVDQFRFYRPWLTDLYQGRLVVPFTLPWVAVLAVSSAVFGTPLVAIGAVAAGLTVGTYLFTHTLLTDRRLALAATVLVALSPFVLILSGTYLNYSLALALELFGGWTLLRGIGAATGAGSPVGGAVETSWRAWPWLVSSGVLWASAVWCRPLDGILVGLPFGVWALVRLLPRRPATGDSDLRQAADPPSPVRRLAGVVGWLIFGATPVVLAMLAVNRKATGEALTFPVSAQSGGAARVGWGMRGLFRNELTIDYTAGRAFSALGRNSEALPTWLIGSYLAVALAVYGAWRLWRRDRAATGLLLGLGVICPIGYLGWFASTLTEPGAYLGIGPHYYLPSVVPLGVFAAVGGLDLWHRRRLLAAVGALVCVAVTVAFAVPKVQAKVDIDRYNGGFVRAVERAVDERGDRPPLVVLPPARGIDGVMRLQDQLANRPDLSGPVLYALDRGPGLFDLLAEHPDRAPFRLTTELRPGGDLATPDPVVRPIAIVSGAVTEVHTTVVSTTRNPVVAATVEQGGRVVPVQLDDQATFGKRYELTWRFGAGGAVDVVVGGAARRVPLRLDLEGEVGIGAASGADRTMLAESDPGRAVRTFPYRRNPADGTIEASTATAEFVYFGGPGGAVLPIDIDDQIRATVTGG